MVQGELAQLNETLGILDCHDGKRCIQSTLVPLKFSASHKKVFHEHGLLLTTNR
jgi:hypothetical protein